MLISVQFPDKTIFETIRKWIKDSRSSSCPEISSQLDFWRKEKYSVRSKKKIVAKYLIFMEYSIQLELLFADFQKKQSLKHYIKLKKKYSQTRANE